MMRRVSCVFLLAAAMMNGGCGGGLITDVTVPREPLNSVYWSLSVNYRALNLALAAPYNTVQLIATPVNAFGDTIEGTYTPVFTVLDTTRLFIDSAGMLRARAAGSNLKVSVSLQIGTVTHTDTAFVKVTAAAPANPLATLSIQPAATDSTTWAWGGENKTIRPSALDIQNRNMANLQTAYTSSNLRIATISTSGTTNGSLAGRAAGTTWITASTYAYGVYRTDSVEYTIGLPVQQIIDMMRIMEPNGTESVRFAPSTVTIATGGRVIFRINTNGWTVQTGTPAILFDTPEHVKGLGLPATPCVDADDGNAAANRINEDCPGGGIIYRIFDTPGEYVYRDGAGRTTARIIVGTSTP